MKFLTIKGEAVCEVDARKLICVFIFSCRSCHLLTIYFLIQILSEL